MIFHNESIEWDWIIESVHTVETEYVVADVLDLPALNLHAQITGLVLDFELLEVTDILEYYGITSRKLEGCLG